MANPTISQITIGSNTYDVCDATARNLATPKILFMDLGWNDRNQVNGNGGQLNGTHWCGNQLIKRGCWRGVLWTFFQGQVNFNDKNGNNSSESWGQFQAYISHNKKESDGAGRNYHIFPKTGNSNDNQTEAPYVEWSPQRIACPKFSGGPYVAIRLHTQAVSFYTSRTNFSSRMTTCGYVGSGGTDRVWNISYHSNATFFYFPASIEDNTTISQGATTISSSASEDGSNGNPDTKLFHFVASYDDN